MKILTFFGVFFLLFLVSCSNELKEVESNQIIVVSSKIDSLYSALFLKQYLDLKNRFMPIEENYYNLKWITPNDFNLFKAYPLIICLKISSPKDQTGDAFYDRMFKNKNDSSKVDIINNYYSKNQSIIGIEAIDAIEFKNILFNYDSILSDCMVNRIDADIFSKYKEIPKNENIIDDIRNKFGLDIVLDHNYEYIRNNDSLLWVGRGRPSLGDPIRWVIVKEIDKCLNPRLCLSEIQNTFNEIVKDSSLLRISDFQDRNSYKLTHNNNYIIGGTYVHSDIFVFGDKVDTIPKVGGPYVSYIYNINNNKSVLFIGLINNPGNNKMIYLKQIESVFKQIKKKGEYSYE
ncbi:MAG: hypothetical protein CMG00_05020 [Candidatus Marinimicrobia bacterium]|nr:hypothetical protein [Candidatus Neomarinimicrobiota bacterium]|tara:strand:+ start:197 stop:1234 length:1038 start_codon:yes stop_codon:yes gene_type:complete